MILSTEVFIIYASILFLSFSTNEYGAYSISGPHIADVNVLLPPKMTNPVEYRLLGSHGCFKWSWDHHDILSVLPEYNGSNHCSTSARLRSVGSYAGRKETAIYATDVRTKIVVRCKVYIDMFTKIQIFHNSIKLDLDGLATLQVRAFDSEDNVFSSLVGLRFKWHLMAESDTSAHHLVHVPLSDSPLSDRSGYCGDLDVQIKLEDSGVFSDLLVVKGTQIGHELVSVRLFEPEFDNMTDKIVLTVAEAMSLDPPSPVFVLVGAALQFTLKVLRGNFPQVVPLPSPFHHWSASNSSVAQVNSMMGAVDAFSLGETSIIVEDTRVAGHFQISSLNVVLPDHLSLFLLPVSQSGDPLERVESAASNGRWYVVSGRQYFVDVKVFSRGPSSQIIFMTKNENVILDYDEPEHLKISPVPDSTAVKYGWQNLIMLEPTSQGLGKLSASLTYFSGHLERKEAVKVVQEIIVCDQVKSVEEGNKSLLSPLLLPWSPDVYQEAGLHAVGGCAETPLDYKWLSSDDSVLSVSAMGVVQAKKPGKALVKVVSVYDSRNFDEVAIEVAIPSSIVMQPIFPVETLVASNLYAAVAMKASCGGFFYRCDAFLSSIIWSIGGDSFVLVNTTSEASPKNQLEKVEQSNHYHHAACSWTSLYARSPGQAILRATFSKHIGDGSSRQISLKASAPVASYLPLVVHQAGDGNKFGGYWLDMEKVGIHEEQGHVNELYLVPGATLDILLVGGPYRWGKGVEFIETMDILTQQSVTKEGSTVYPVPIMEGSGYRIACHGLGNFTLVFKRGNLIGNDHPQPVVAEARMNLQCSFPFSIVVLADEPANKLDVLQTAIRADRGPGRIQSTPVTVANGRTIRVSAVGITDSGKAFANSSFVPLQWELENCEELASWDEAYHYQVSTYSWEQFLTLKNASGKPLSAAGCHFPHNCEATGCIVRAAVENKLFSGYSSYSKKILTDALPLQVVSTVQVFPEFSLLFFHPDAKINLSVIGGSCLLDAVVNDSRVVEVLQPIRGLQCSHLTLAPRSFGPVLVSVYDTGLMPPLTAASVVKVADVDWLKIMATDLLSLMEGTTGSVGILAGTDDGNTFDHSQYSFMNIHVHIKDPIIELVDDKNVSRHSHGYAIGSGFNIYGRCAGVTTLYVTATQRSGREIFSQIVKVEVYDPPVIHPGDIFLVPGASYVVTVKGGPQIGVSVEYTSLNGSTVAVQESVGRLSAVSLGTATIVATFYGNERAVICQAHGKVSVGIPSAAMLISQSEKLAVGREMPIFPSLIEGDLFSFYELCKDYNWTIENEKVLSFHPSPESDVSFRRPRPCPRQTACVDKEENLIKVLYGRSGGRSNVALTFSCDFSSPSYSHLRSYSAMLSIRVVSDPPLAEGIRITWILPPHYITSDLLPSISESDSSSDLQSQAVSLSYTVLGFYGRKDDDLQKDVVSISGKKIKTTDSNNLACIQVTDHVTGRIEVASCVRVSEVAQIRFVRNLELSVLNVTVGDEIEVPIRYYDDLGNPFLEAYDIVVVNIETNYQDILSLDVDRRNGSVIIKALRHGRALVGLSINGIKRKSDYILVLVGAHIHPENPILLPGSYVNFVIEGMANQTTGHWVSANESVVTVDSLSGRTAAVGKGTASVAFESSMLKLQTTVRVLSADAIYVDAPQETLTNVLSPPGGYRFPVKFSIQKFAAHSNDIEVPYECRVEPTFIGYANPWRDLYTGDFYCVFFPYTPEQLKHSVPKSMNKRLDISVSIQAILKEAPEVAGTSSAPFVGGFCVLNIIKESNQLAFTPEFNRSTLTIVGNTDVDIHWFAKDALMIRMLFNEGSNIAGYSEYEVKVLKPKSFRDKIILALPASGQRIEVEVNYDTGNEKEQKPSSEQVKRVLVTVIISLITLVVVTIVILRRRGRSHPSTFPTSDAATPRTPEHSSPALVNDESPRTPQPFIEYVRRTIDETPYYRREGRRFDPQNTY